MVYHEAFGLYEGEPTNIEILQRKQYHTENGRNSLAISHRCPACGGKDTEWVRQEWAICFDCIISFDQFEMYIDLTDDGSENPNLMEDE